MPQVEGLGSPSPKPKKGIKTEKMSEVKVEKMKGIKAEKMKGIKTEKMNRRQSWAGPRPKLHFSTN